MSVSLTSSVFLTCTPFASTFTTTQTITLPAACPTSAWTATYTIVEVCTGDQATFTPPPFPPNFVVTTVVCDNCATPTMAITCPVAVPMRTGDVVIEGNGFTAGTAGVAPMETGMAMPGDTTTTANGPYATAGAPSLKESLAFLAPLALLAVQFVL